MFNKKKHQIEQLQQKLSADNEQIKSLTNELSIANNEINSLLKENTKFKSEIKLLKDKLKDTDFEQLNKKLAFSRQELTRVNLEVHNKAIELKQLNEGIIETSKKLYIQQCGMYELSFPIEYYKDELTKIRQKESEMLYNDKYYKCLNSWIINGNSYQGQMLAKFLCKTCITSFNLTCDSLLEQLKVHNLEQIKKRLEKIYGNYNYTLRQNDLCLSMDYYNLKMKELELVYNVVLKRQQDKEEEKHQKEIIKQQALAEKELQKEKDKLEKELLHYKLQEEKGKDVSDKIEEIKARLETNDYRLCHELSGYVYFIVNKSFNNDNWVKVGVTRRIDPELRISELSSASVPFKFYPLGIVFTDNAYDLENKLHKRLNEYRVNKFNIRKEYFDINIDELEKIVNDEFNLGLKFNKNINDEDWEYSIDKSTEM